MPESEMTAEDPPPPPRRTRFEWSLAALRPVDSDATRPSFLFKAGQASRDGAVRFWRWVAIGCAVALAGVVAVSGLMITDAQHRAAVAEARAVSPPLPVGRGAGGEGAMIHPLPASTSAGDLPLKGGDAENTSPLEGEVESPQATREGGRERNVPSILLPLGSQERSFSPHDIAAALRTRRDILVGGLGMVPDPNPDLPGDPGRLTLPPTVLAAPKAAPRRPSPIEPDDSYPPDTSR